MRFTSTLATMAATATLAATAAVPAHAIELREVHGSLKTADGVPYAGMQFRVEAVDRSWTDQGVLDANGEFSYYVPAGMTVRFWAGVDEMEDPAYGSIFCSGADYFGDDGTGITVDPSLTRLDVRMPAARYATVSVVDAQGQPVRNVEVNADSWATRAGRLDLGPNYRPCMDGGELTPRAAISGYPGINYVAGWIPGFTGGTTDSNGSITFATVGPLMTEHVGVLNVRLRPGTGEQTLSVPTSSLTGTDPHHLSAVVELPQAPLTAVVPGTTDGDGGAVDVTTSTGDPVAGAEMALVPVLAGDTPETPREGQVQAMAVTNAAGRATFTGVRQGGRYRAVPTNVSARSVDLTIAGAPAPPADARPAATVKVKATKRASKLYVDVNPNRGSRYWTFRVERQGANGTWARVGAYRTKGKKETRTINLRKGTYRVVLHDQYGYRGMTSAPVRLKK